MNGMIRILIVLVLLTVTNVLSACCIAPYGSFLYPSTPQGRAIGNGCCGANGPREVLVIGGPKKSLYTLFMKRSAERVQGMLTVYIPKDVKVDFLSNVILIKDSRSSQQYEYKITQVYHEAVDHWNPRNCPNYTSLHLKDRLGSNELKPKFTEYDHFPGHFEGTGGNGSLIWIEILPAQISSDSFTVILPDFMIDGEEFQILPIEYKRLPGRWELIPLNC